MGRHSRRGLFLLGLLLWLGRAVPSAAVEGTCASPTVIPSGGGVFTGTTSGASAITLSCQTNTSLAPESVFVWTPAVSGTAVLSTAHSNFDTVLAVETQCGVASSTLAGGCVNDGAACCGGCNGVAGLWDSTATVTVTAGTPLFVIVDGYGSCSASTCTDRNSGPYRLVVTPPGASTTTQTCPATTTTSTTTSSTTTTTVVPPSYPQNLQVQTIQCGNQPHVRLTWSPSTAGSQPIAGYMIYKWDGTAFKPDRCTDSCPGGVDGHGACCPGHFNGGVLTLSGDNPCTSTLCTFDEILDAPGEPFYSVAAYDTSGPARMSLPPTTCPSWSAVVNGGGTCGPGVFLGCTAYPCFQCTCDTTTGCNTGWCDPMASAKCGDCSTCLVATTTTTTTTTTSSTTTTTIASNISAVSFGGTGKDGGRGVTVDTNGNTLIVGGFENSASFGGSVLVSAGNADVFVAKYASNGAHVWSKRIGGDLFDRAEGVAVDSSGNVVVMGTFQNSASGAGVDFSPGEAAHVLMSNGDWDIFVAKYAAADGHYLWAKSYGSAGEEIANGIGIDHSANCDTVGGTDCVLATGIFYGTVNFGGTTLTASSNGSPYVLKLNSANGNTVLAHKFVVGGQSSGEGITADATGNIIVGGDFAGHLFPNNADAVFNLTAAGLFDTFVIKETKAGAYIWSKQLAGPPGNQTSTFLTTLAVDSNGDVGVVASSNQPSIVWGGSCGTVPNASGATDVVYGKLAGSSGSCVWAKAAGSSGDDYGLGLVFDASNNMIVSGLYPFTLNINGTTVPLTTGSDGDAFVAKYSSSGVASWVGHVPNATRMAENVAVDTAGGRVFVTGSYSTYCSPGAVCSGGGCSNVGATCLNQSNCVGPLISCSCIASTNAICPVPTTCIGGGFCKPRQFGGSALVSNGVTDVYVVHLPLTGP